MYKDVGLVVKFATSCLALLLPILAQASISMGADVVPYGSEPEVIQQTIVPPFSQSVAPAGPVTTTVDITQRDCVPYVGKGPTPPNPCPIPVEETVTTTTVTQFAEPIMVEVHTGSLKANVERIVRECGWETTIWKMPYDYNWIGDVTITANDVQGALTKLLEGYPVQAVFYNANHVVAIVPRRNE